MHIKYVLPLVLLSLAVLYSCEEEQRNVLDQTNRENTQSQPYWQIISKPMGNDEIAEMTIHPENGDLWLVQSWKGLYITRDGGANWENHLEGYVSDIVIDPDEPSRIYAANGKAIYLSTNVGQSWIQLATFPNWVQSLLLSKIDGALYAGIRWEWIDRPNGVFKSTDQGETWTFHSYNVEDRGLIPWVIAEDEVNNKIYIATENFDHPEPYNPPFFRSSDNGNTWEDISGTLPWHVIRIQIHPKTNNLYVLTEGAGLYSSIDFGDTWQRINDQFGLELMIEPNEPYRFFGGDHTYGPGSGGAFISDNQGNSFKPFGLKGRVVGSIVPGSETGVFFASCYKGGIYRIEYLPE